MSAGSTATSATPQIPPRPPRALIAGLTRRRSENRLPQSSPNKTSSQQQWQFNRPDSGVDVETAKAPGRNAEDYEGLSLEKVVSGPYPFGYPAWMDGPDGATSHAHATVPMTPTAPPTKPPRMSKSFSQPNIALPAEPPPKPTRHRIVQSIAAAAAHALKDGVLRPTSLVISHHNDHAKASLTIPSEQRPQTWCTPTGPTSPRQTNSTFWSTLGFTRSTSASAISLQCAASEPSIGSDRQPTIHTLHPSDIKSLICLGDSLMTGLCLDDPNALTSKQTVVSHITKSGGNKHLAWLLSGEHRHRTCISGGAPGVLSIGKLLQVFSPELRGLSLSKTRCGAKSDGAWNLARSGSSVRDVRDQVVDLVAKLNKPEHAYLKSSWKMVFIWCGGNDVLQGDWSGDVDREAERRILQPLVEALQLLRSCVNKCFVCLLTIPDISGVLGADATEQGRADCRHRSEAANRCLRRVVSSYDWTSGSSPSSFTVTAQPTIESPLDATVYQKYFASTADGAHPNALAHQAFAKSVWNNLFHSDDQKWTSVAEVISGDWFRPTAEDKLT